MKAENMNKKELIKEVKQLRSQVTKLKKATNVFKNKINTLKQTEAYFQSLFEKAPIGYQSLDENGNILLANKAWLKTLGYDRDEVIGKWFGDFLAPDNTEFFKQQFNQFKSEGECRNVEFKMICKNKSSIIVQLDGTIGYDDVGHLLQTHCVLTDITERKRAGIAKERAEEMIKESEEKYRGLFKNATDFVYTLDLMGNFTDVNRASKRLSGYKKAELIGMNFREYIPKNKQRRIFLAFNRILKTGRPMRDFPFEVIIKDGKKKYFETSVSLLKKGEEIIGFQGISRDITEREQLVEKLRESEARYRSLFENSVMGISQTLPNGRIICANSAFARMYSYDDPESMMAEVSNVEQQLYANPEDREEVLRILQEKGVVEPREIRVRRRDGTQFTVLVGVREIKDDSGNLVCYQAEHIDITERKRAEEAFHESADRFRQLFENMSSGVAVYEATKDGEDFIFKDFNKAAERIEQIAKQDLISKSVTQVFPDVTEFGLFEVFQRVWKTGVPEHHPISFYKDDRISGWRENYVYKLSSGEIMAIYDDITERKRAEEALRAAEELFSKAFLANPDAMSISRLSDGMIIKVNDMWEKVFGYSRAESIGKTSVELGIFCDPAMRQKAVQLLRETGSIRNFELDVCCKTGEVRQVILSSERLEVGGQENFITISHDITERKKIEDALRESEEMFRNIFETSLIGVAICSTDKKWLYVNNQICKILGYSDRELRQTTWEKLTYPDDLEADVSQYNRLLAGEIENYNLEKRFIRKDGSLVYTRIYISCKRNEHGAVEYDIGLLEDITERKRAEEALRESETRLRSFQDSATDGLMVFDSRLNLTDINQAALEILGVKKRDMVGKNVLEISPDAKTTGRYDKYLEVLGTGNPCFIDEVVPHSKFRKRYLSLRIFKVGDGLGIIGTDITERKLAEREANEYRKELQSLSAKLMASHEEERKKISTELHDELGQTLTALSINLSTIEKALPAGCNPLSVERLEESTRLVDSMSDELHEIILALRPSMLDDLGLIPTVHWYIKRFEDRTKIKVGLLCSHFRKRLPVEIETVLYRSIQEAMTNTAKHAKAKNVQIAIVIKPVALEMTIKDDGQGFNLKDLSREYTPDMGVGLLGIRERLLSVKGKLNVQSNKGKGTRLEITIPLGGKS